jgi:hypothetical protein
MSTKLAFIPLNHTKSTSRKILSLQCEKYSNRYKLKASSGITAFNMGKKELFSHCCHVTCCMTL